MGLVQKKMEITARVAVLEPNGQPGTVVEHTEFIREQLVDGSWTPWLQSTRRFMWGRMQVNPREDGNWETPEYEPRQLTRQP